MRTPWTEVGVFDRDTRSYVVDRIPKPPEARAIFERDECGRESVVGHELKVGCAKCFNQTIVCWLRAYSDRMVSDFRDDGHPEIMAVAVAREMHDVAARAEIEAAGARRREGEARELAAKATAAFKRIQVKRSRQERKKQTKRRAKGRAK